MVRNLYHPPQGAKEGKKMWVGQNVQLERRLQSAAVNPCSLSKTQSRGRFGFPGSLDGICFLNSLNTAIAISTYTETSEAEIQLFPQSTQQRS